MKTFPCKKCQAKEKEEGNAWLCEECRKELEPEEK